MVDVRVGEFLAAQIAEEFPEERSPTGDPAEADFWSGPLAAALLAFRDFESLRFDDVPQIRNYLVNDPVFGIVVFFGVSSGERSVELIAFARDPDYWDVIDSDPDD